jgi:hypothetical protein
VVVRRSNDNEDAAYFDEGYIARTSLSSGQTIGGQCAGYYVCGQAAARSLRTMWRYLSSTHRGQAGAQRVKAAPGGRPHQDLRRPGLLQTAWAGNQDCEHHQTARYHLLLGRCREALPGVKQGAKRLFQPCCPTSRHMDRLQTSPAEAPRSSAPLDRQLGVEARTRFGPQTFSDAIAAVYHGDG